MEVKHVKFSYGKQEVLKDISFQVPKGKITTLLGANGCGKSTLFSVMTKNLEPQDGAVYLDGENIANIRLKDFARQAAIVHQYNTASKDITVGQLVDYGRIPYAKMLQGQSDEDEKMTAWALEVTNMTKYKDRQLTKLSGGQKQRAWIAMALAQNTKILFLDEPTTYLDVRYQIETLELIRKLNRKYGITIIMVLHDINQAIYYSDQIIGMKDGYISICGDPKEVITSESLYDLYGVHLRILEVEGKLITIQSSPAYRAEDEKKYKVS